MRWAGWGHGGIAGASDHEDDLAFNAAIAPLLPLVAGGLAALFVGFAALHPLLLDGAARLVMTPLAAMSAGLFGAVFFLLRRGRLAAASAHPVTAAMLAVAAANAVTHLVLTAEPWQTTNLMLLLVASGALLLILRWLLVMLYLLWGAWAFGAVLIGPSPQWPHYLIGMVTATVLAVALNHVRRGSVVALAAAQQAAEAAAVRDPLTGVSNRRGLAMLGTRLVEQARRQGDAVYCVFLDIDGLKQVNDDLGRDAGDAVVMAVVGALRQVTRAADVVARWGDDAFCVLGPGAGMAPLELERRIAELVVAAATVDPQVWRARVNAGGAMLAPWDSGSLDTLLSKADREMHLRRSLRKARPDLPRRRPGDRVTE